MLHFIGLFHSTSVWTSTACISGNVGVLMCVRIKNVFQNKIEHIKRIYKEWVDGKIERKKESKKEEEEEKDESTRQIYRK